MAKSPWSVNSLILRSSVIIATSFERVLFWADETPNHAGVEGLGSAGFLHPVIPGYRRTFDPSSVRVDGPRSVLRRCFQTDYPGNPPQPLPQPRGAPKSFARSVGNSRRSIVPQASRSASAPNRNTSTPNRNVIFGSPNEKLGSDAVENWKGCETEGTTNRLRRPSS